MRIHYLVGRFGYAYGSIDLVEVDRFAAVFQLGVRLHVASRRFHVAALYAERLLAVAAEHRHQRV